MKHRRGSRASRTQKNKQIRIDNIRNAQTVHEERTIQQKTEEERTSLIKESDARLQKKKDYAERVSKRKALQAKKVKPQKKRAITLTSTGVRAPVDTAYTVLKNGDRVFHLMSEL